MPILSRMTATARKRGVTLTSRSRPLRPEDLAEVRQWRGCANKPGDGWRQSAGGCCLPVSVNSRAHTG